MPFPGRRSLKEAALELAPGAGFCLITCGILSRGMCLTVVSPLMYVTGKGHFGAYKF